MTIGVKQQARLITADGRDVTDKEWRKLPEFPEYEINDETDIRRWSPIRGWYLIAAHPNGNSWSYTLYAKGRKTSRNYWKLMLTAFPETDQGWKTIPNHPNYEINKKGEVRGKKRHHLVQPNRWGSFVLRRNGTRVSWHPHDLYEFPDFWASDEKKAA